MNCEAFDLWLDQGSPEAGAARARAHAGECVRCARTLAAVHEIEELLDQAPVVAPAGFADRVMAHVAAAEAAHAFRAREAALAWWVRIAAQPAPALALALGALVAWKYTQILAAATLLATTLAVRSGTLAAAASAQAAPVAGWFARGDVRLALVWVVAPAVAWGSLSLYRWTERQCAVTGALPQMSFRR